jgi:hypothetical protein
MSLAKWKTVLEPPFPAAYEEGEQQQPRPQHTYTHRNAYDTGEILCEKIYVQI